jgi:hypothetical protein
MPKIVDETDRCYRMAAKRMFHRDGEVELDIDNPKQCLVSKADSSEGAYVQAWVWVPRQEAAAERVSARHCNIHGWRTGAAKNGKCDVCGAPTRGRMIGEAHA